MGKFLAYNFLGKPDADFFHLVVQSWRDSACTIIAAPNPPRRLGSFLERPLLNDGDSNIPARLLCLPQKMDGKKSAGRTSADNRDLASVI